MARPPSLPYLHRELSLEELIERVEALLPRFEGTPDPLRGALMAYVPWTETFHGHRTVDASVVGEAVLDVYTAILRELLPARA